MKISRRYRNAGDKRRFIRCSHRVTQKNDRAGRVDNLYENVNVRGEDRRKCKAPIFGGIDVELLLVNNSFKKLLFCGRSLNIPKSISKSD